MTFDSIILKKYCEKAAVKLQSRGQAIGHDQMGQEEKRNGIHERL